MQQQIDIVGEGPIQDVLTRVREKHHELTRVFQEFSNILRRAEESFPIANRADMGVVLDCVGCSAAYVEKRPQSFIEYEYCSTACFNKHGRKGQ